VQREDAIETGEANQFSDAIIIRGDRLPNVRSKNFLGFLSIFRCDHNSWGSTAKCDSRMFSIPGISNIIDRMDWKCVKVSNKAENRWDHPQLFRTALSEMISPGCAERDFLSGRRSR
jgi:hypothetical protein